jgi:hypothetical protein
MWAKLTRENASDAFTPVDDLSFAMTPPANDRDDFPMGTIEETSESDEVYELLHDGS